MSQKFGYPRVTIKGIFHLYLFLSITFFTRFTQPKSVLPQAYSFFAGFGFLNTFYENRNLPSVSDKQPKSFLVPGHEARVSKTWRILGSLFLSQRKFNTPRLVKKQLKIALRPLLKRMTETTNPRYLKSAANSFMRAQSLHVCCDYQLSHRCLVLFPAY